jgi:glucose-6-phosphate 1-epimerase
MADFTPRWLIEDHLRLAKGVGGLARLEIETAHATAHIYLHGAQVTHFAPRFPHAPATSARDVLFLSASSHFTAGKAIRGGVPVIFPWFGPRDGQPGGAMHGFARTQTWEIENAQLDASGCVEMVLRLESNDATRALWPHRFVMRHRIRIDAALTLSLHVENSGTEEFVFEEALHSYLAVVDVHGVNVEGLAGCEYIDKTSGGTRQRDDAAIIHFTGETDRVYLHTGARCIVHDPRGQRRIRIDKEASATTVIWNPGRAKAASLADLGNDEWLRFVCVESANVAENQIRLAPGEAHTMTAIIRSEAELAIPE